MNNLTPELIAKAKTAKSAQELLEIARENGAEITEQEARTYLEQLNANGAVKDDELEAVVGGSCPKPEEGSLTEAALPCRTRVLVINGKTCPECGGRAGISVLNARYRNYVSICCERCPRSLISEEIKFEDILILK